MSFNARFVQLIVVLQLVAVHAVAQTRQEILARVNGLTAEGARELVLKAQSGDALSQYVLGLAKKRGQSVARNDSEAREWIRKSAEQGYTLAEMELANIYLQGDGVAADPKEGMVWLRKAANHRDSTAQFLLGYTLELQGNLSEAVDWYRKAADQGLSLAQTALGFCYEQGKGIHNDDKQAVSWYLKAAEQGDTNAQSNLGSMYFEGKGVKKDHFEASKWYQRSADGGWAIGQLNLANLYVSGDGVPRDYVVAYMWYSIAASSGEQTSQTMIAALATKMKKEQIDEAIRRAQEWSKTHTMSRHVGAGVFIDDPKPSKEQSNEFQKLMDRAQRGDPEAQSQLGEAYYRAQDYKNAFLWFRKSAEQGYSYGQYNVGVMYMEGSGIAKDEAESVKWFLKSAEQRTTSAMNNLAAAFFYGRGVNQDIAQAYMWSSIAAQLGDENSRKNLAGLKSKLSADQVGEAERKASQWLTEHPKK